MFDELLEYQDSEDGRAEIVALREERLSMLRPKRRNASAKYRKEHPDIIKKRAWMQKYRSIYLDRLLANQNNRCYHCGCILSPSITEIDHLLPLSQGGTNGFANLCASCVPCNRKRQ